jgi:biopolymer transport protein ExbD
VASVDSPEPKEKKGKKGKRKMHRVGIRIDMTPMVDVAFLLLIFFMVTTVFRTPRAMEINVPPNKDTKIEIAQSKVLMLRAVEGDKVYLNMAVDKPAVVDLKDLRKLLIARAKQFYNPATKESDLNVVIKVERAAKFHNLVDLIDALSMAKITRFGFAPFTDDDKKQLAGA